MGRASAGRRDQRFVGVFVNEMYAILLGIGLGSVIFSESFELTNARSVVLAVFATAVVLVYWWDWTDFVGEHVATSLGELFLDFLELIVMVYLFRTHESPAAFAATLAVLAVSDLVWVANHLRGCVACRRLHSSGWIPRKFLGVAILGAVWLVVRFGEPGLRALHPIVGHWMPVVVLVAGFLAVRRFASSHVRSVPRARFRPARAADAAGIAAVHAQWAGERTEEAGFLLTPLKREDVERSLESENDRYFVVVGEEEEVLAFASVSDGVPSGLRSDLDWFEEFPREEFEREPRRVVDLVAVRGDRTRRGLGGFLYHSLFARYPESWWCGFVSVAPRRNAASLAFHEAAGFRYAARFRRSGFLGQKDYESLLLARPPRS